jgi:tetratricopeptide (TPR) repeat protein
MQRASPALPVSHASAAAMAAYDEALDRFLACSGDPLAVIGPALDAEPGFAAGHTLAAGIAVATWDKRSFPLLRRSLEAMLPLARSANERERAHFAAARAWLAAEYSKAADRYAAIVREWPGDALALRLTQASSVFIGRSGGHLEVVGPAAQAWRPGMPGYEHVLTMHAYALAENGEGARAADLGRKALELRPRNPSAIHAVAHALLNQGAAAEGAKWMAARAEDWKGDGPLARHGAWHDAIFQLELGRIDRALAIYDAAPAAGAASDAGDAAALLWRLHLEGVDVAERWDAVADLWAARAGDAFWPLLDVHAMMAFAAAAREHEARELLGVMSAAAEGCTATATVVREVALPMARAVLAFGREQYGRAIELAAPVRADLWRIGGSHTQREALDLMVLEAAIRAGRAELAQALVAERRGAAPLSPRARVQAVRAGALVAAAIRAAA